MGKGNRKRAGEGGTAFRGGEADKHTHASHCETVWCWSVWEGSTVAADSRRPAPTTAVSPLP